MAATRYPKEIRIYVNRDGSVSQVEINSDIEVSDADNAGETFVEREFLQEPYADLTTGEQGVVDKFVSDVGGFLTRKRPVS